jgi:glycosyltransferase involved in cell wall biosynthesis
MKIHVLANPNNPTGLVNRTDAFAVHAHKYIKYLSQHYEIVHYGISGAQVNCEHVDIFPIDNNYIKSFNINTAEEIKKRKSSGDIIACFFGTDNKLACDLNPDCIAIEPSIGYRSNAVFSNYRVFTSYSNMTYFYGERGMLMNPSWFDAVIGNPFTISEFDFCNKKEDYFIYLGRVIEEKGIRLAIQATEKLGVKLKIAGPSLNLKHLGYKDIPNHVEVLGSVNVEQRNNLLGNARALLGLTHYIEPFGNMVIEANLCGTPVITTDWGAFPEIVVNGVTGYRVRDFGELITALDMVQYLNPIECRNHGLKFSDENIHELHHRYIEKIIRNSFYD